MSPNYCCKIWDNVRSLQNIEKQYPDCEIILLCKGQFNGLNANTKCTFLITERKTPRIFRNANKKNRPKEYVTIYQFLCSLL